MSTTLARRPNFFEGVNIKSLKLNAHLPLTDSYREMIDRLIADADATGAYGVSCIKTQTQVRLLIRRNAVPPKKSIRATARILSEAT